MVVHQVLTDKYWMKAKEFISELFDPKKAVPFKWVNAQEARAQLPDNRYLIVNFRPSVERNWNSAPYSVEFSVNDEFDVTGGGHVSSIFATVIEIIKKFTERKHGLLGLFFTAEEPSRAKMYDTLSKRVAKQMGWHVVPHDELANTPSYKTEMSSGNFVFAIEPGHAPEHRQHAQQPQHSEFMPIFFVASMEHIDLPAIKVKAKKAGNAINWVLANVPEYKDEDHMAVNAYSVPPTDRQIIDKGTVK
jgi:hypothetical protein